MDWLNVTNTRSIRWLNLSHGVHAVSELYIGEGWRQRSQMKKQNETGKQHFWERFNSWRFLGRREKAEEKSHIFPKLRRMKKSPSCFCCWAPTGSGTRWKLEGRSCPEESWAGLWVTRGGCRIIWSGQFTLRHCLMWRNKCWRQHLSQGGSQAKFVDEKQNGGGLMGLLDDNGS